MATSAPTRTALTTSSNGTRDRSVAACATRAKSWASWRPAAASTAHPVDRACITSEWSPKMDRAWVPIVRAATWITQVRAPRRS